MSSLTAWLELIGQQGSVVRMYCMALQIKQTGLLVQTQLLVICNREREERF